MIIEIDFWADHGHFSHPATIYSSLTYPIPTKTAIMGFLGAVGGLEDINAYHFLNTISYSIKINEIRGKENYCFNGVKDALPSVKGHRQHIKQRKQFYRELLIKPSYKIFIDFSACLEESKEIIENLKNHIALFQPYMGINLCLANFEFIAQHEDTVCENSEYLAIDSFITLDMKFEIEFDKNYSDIRMPLSIEEGRIFGKFRDCLVELNGNSILAKPKKYSRVGSYNLVFL